MSTNYMLVCHLCKKQTDLVIRTTVGTRWTSLDGTTEPEVLKFLAEHKDHHRHIGVIFEHDPEFIDYEDLTS